MKRETQTALETTPPDILGSVFDQLHTITADLAADRDRMLASEEPARWIAYGAIKRAIEAAEALTERQIAQLTATQENSTG